VTEKSSMVRVQGL